MNTTNFSTTPELEQMKKSYFTFTVCYAVFTWSMDWFKLVFASIFNETAGVLGY